MMTLGTLASAVTSALAYKTISFVGEAHTTYSNTQYADVTCPTVAANDYALLTYIAAAASSAPNAPTTVPSGFTLISGPATVNYAGYYVSMWVYGKLLTGAESLTTLRIDSGVTTYSIQSALTVFRNVNTTTPIDVTPSTNSGTGTTYSWDTLTTVTPNVLLVAIGHDWGDTTNNLTPPSGFTERVDLAIVYASDKTQASAGASGAFTMTNNSATGSPWGTMLVPLRPATA